MRNLACFILGITTWAATFSLYASAPRLTGRWGEQITPSQLVKVFPSRSVEIDGRSVQLPARTTSFLVVAALDSHCPLAARAVSDLNQIQHSFARHGVQVIGVFPNSTATVPRMATFALHADAAFPVYLDDRSHSWVVDDLLMKFTPEVVVLDVRRGFDKRTLLYRGLINDALSTATSKSRITTDYVRDTLTNAVATVGHLTDSENTFNETAAQGCKISRRKLPSESDESITFYPAVAQLFQTHCEKCHRPGEVGAERFMPLQTYAEILTASDTIMDRISTGLMPPWHGDVPTNALPELGGLKHDARLSNEEIRLLTSWYENGMPLGNHGSAPQPIAWPDSDDWAIGTPDIVFRMPTPFVVPRQRWDGYMYYYVPINFPTDKYVQAIQLRPGNAAVVHHMGAIMAPTPPTPLQGAEATQYFYGLAGDKIYKIGDWVPGDDFNQRVYPDNVGLHIPANCSLVLEMHYTPTGKEEPPDLSSLAIRFCDRTPATVIRTRVENNRNIKIRPFDGHQVIRDRYWFEDDVDIHALAPHMHYRGKDYTLYKVQNPGTSMERRQKLFEVASYDFRWQRTYEFVHPIRLRAGDFLEAIGHFDNSEYNPNNPDPQMQVRFGLRTEDEMFNTRFKFSYAREATTAN